LWDFTIAKHHYAPIDEFTPPFGNVSESADVQLSDFLRPRRTTFQYLYDFGDDWLHNVIVTTIRAPEAGVASPRYIGGERNAPPEDIGGIYGFYEGLEAVAEDADGDEDMEGWAHAFDPEFVDVESMESRLQVVAERLKTRKPVRGKKPMSALSSREDAAVAESIALANNALRLGSAARRAKPRARKK